MLALITLSALAAFSTPSPSPSPKPTPNPWRQLEFGSPTMGGTPPGHIAVFGGWVAVKRDGRGAHACISFKNEGSVAATSIAFEFPLMNRNGEEVTALKFDRRGTFSPGIEIHGWKSLEAWQGGSNRGYDENCTGTALGVAAFPLLSARMATYRILRVEYADGSSWTP